MLLNTDFSFVIVVVCVLRQNLRSYCLQASLSCLIHSRLTCLLQMVKFPTISRYCVSRSCFCLFTEFVLPKQTTRSRPPPPYDLHRHSKVSWHGPACPRYGIITTAPSSNISFQSQTSIGGSERRRLSSSSSLSVATTATDYGSVDDDSVTPLHKAVRQVKQSTDECIALCLLLLLSYLVFYPPVCLLVCLIIYLFLDQSLINYLRFVCNKQCDWLTSCKVVCLLSISMPDCSSRQLSCVCLSVCLLYVCQSISLPVCLPASFVYLLPICLPMRQTYHLLYICLSPWLSCLPWAI